jgi:hypothetical protein
MLDRLFHVHFGIKQDIVNWHVEYPNTAAVDGNP